MPCSQLNDRRSAPLPSIKFFPVKIPIVGSMSNESFAVSSDRDRFKWAYKHSRQLESLFLFARILSDCGVSWFEITFYEIMSHYHICYPKRNPLLQCDADSTCSGDFCQLASKVTITHKSGASSGSKCPILKWLYVKNHAKLLRGTHQRKRYRIKQLCNEVQLTKGLACIFRPWEMYLKMPSISLQTIGNVREGWSGE